MTPPLADTVTVPGAGPLTSAATIPLAPCAVSWASTAGAGTVSAKPDEVT